MTLRGARAADGLEGAGHDDDIVDVEAAPLDGPAGADRERLAYAIHDGLTQVITASVLELESLAHRAEVRPDEAAEALRQAIGALRSALSEVRVVLATLTPTEPGTVQPIEDLLRSVLERWQLPATWSVRGDLAEIPEAVLEAASSVIREGIANAAKHAGTGEVAVRVHASDRAVVISVEDKGRGFDDDGGSPAGHLGLEMLRRRVADVRGTLDVHSAPGAGTRVVAWLPVMDKE